MHDYFVDGYPNVKHAVYDFERELNKKLHLCPIGDGASIAIVK